MRQAQILGGLLCRLRICLILRIWKFPLKAQPLKTRRIRLRLPQWRPIVPKGAEIDLATFEDFSFLDASAPSDTNASDASEPAPAAAEPQESGHAEPAPVEPVEVDLVNVPMPYDMDATQSIA